MTTKRKALTREQGKRLLSDYLCEPLSPEEAKSRVLVAKWPKIRRQAEEWVEDFFRVLDYLHHYVPREDWNWLFKQLKWPVYGRK